MEFEGILGTPMILKVDMSADVSMASLLKMAVHARELYFVLHRRITSRVKTSLECD